MTDSEGQFELSNVTSGNYEVVAKLKGYYFSTEVLEISPNSPVLPGECYHGYSHTLYNTGRIFVFVTFCLPNP